MSEPVAVLGPAGTFSEQAAKLMFPDSRYEFQSSVEEVFDYVSSGLGLGVVAYENSLEGSIGATMECLREYNVFISGRTTLEINLCLIAKKGTKIEDVKLILSHPKALGQCRQYLKNKLSYADTKPTSSTAEAVRMVIEMPGAAAIGYRQAAREYGVEILDEFIQDDKSYTRFISISQQKVVGDKASIIFAVKDEPGALYSIIEHFAKLEINMTKIESRPARNQLGEYIFYVDYCCKKLDEDQRQNLHELIKQKTTYFKDLGSY